MPLSIPRSAPGLVVLFLCVASPGALLAQSSEQVVTTVQLVDPLGRRTVGKLDVGGAAR